MRKNWWKYLALVLIIYSIVGGLLIRVPVLAILHESIRNLYFHVPMWFAMIAMYTVSVVYSIKYLSNSNYKNDLIAVESVNTGILFCALGLVTGMLWAKNTWGAFWPNDPKLNGSAIATLMYLAYVVLRNSLDDPQKRAKISAVYNLFAFPIMIVLLFVLPRQTDSLHPGNGGNPGFGGYDLDGMMRLVLYPTFIGWILVSTWIMTLRYRIRLIEHQKNELN